VNSRLLRRCFIVSSIGEQPLGAIAPHLGCPSYRGKRKLACGAACGLELKVEAGKVTRARGDFRFHGRNAENWEKKDVSPAERFRYLYDQDELADWTPRITTVARQTKQTHVLMNNCFSNYGTTNGREIARLLEEYQT
jgi:uncharacterized protein YecE (DUF72 family)